jgi:hypothetical protein
MNIRHLQGKIAVLLMITGLFIAIIYGSHMQNSTGLSNLTISAAGKSRVEIVTQMNRIMAEIARIEKTEGATGEGGYVVYPARTTSKLLALYQALDSRLTYLNSGKMPPNRKQWDGYALADTKSKPYTTAQVMKVMAELQANGVPGKLIKGLHIFLLPNSIPDVSGLGGAGFVLISAPTDSTKTDADMAADLAVTLEHETGHHVQMRFMPKGSPDGDALWRDYLAIRGGTWHGPGAVNTKGWSDSSEETFAEDFRMLFGKDQPYFGDVTLGDPRENPEQAGRVKNFIIQLEKQQTIQSYHSPWMPKGMSLVFWNQQDVLISFMWACLGAGGWRIHRKRVQNIPAGLGVEA